MGFHLKKILVAEDDRYLSRSLDTWLTLEGFHVISVYHGEEALNKLVNDTFDLLITDIAMPRLNGLELIGRIRRLHTALPILVVSGKLTTFLRDDLRRLGIQHILSKPIKPLDFRTVIESLFPETRQAS